MIVGGALLLRGGEFEVGKVSESRLVVAVCAIGRVVTLLVIECVATLGDWRPPTRVLVLMEGESM